MQRTLPAHEQIQQVDQRVHELQEAVISNIKDSQILRSNFTTMLHTYKETNEKIKFDFLDTLSSIKKDFQSLLFEYEQDHDEMQQKILEVNLDRRGLQDEILLLDQKLQEVETDFGVFNYEEILDSK
jgi:hypothetical protein